MQPELPTSPEAHEQLPQSHERPQGVESGIPTVEQAPERRSEQQERQAEAAARVSETYRQADPVSTPQPTVVQPVQDDTQSGVPATAADEDLIEKEWVDKIKQVIIETRDDPAERERAAARLQAEYLRKRYGKELGSA